MRCAALCLLPSMLLLAQGPHALSLPNGLRLEATEDFGRSLMRVRLRLPMPAVSGWRPGLPAFALEVLEHSSTGSHSRGSFTRTLDHAGLSLSRSQDAQSVTWELLGPPQGLDVGLALLADQVIRLQLDSTAVERARLRLHLELQNQSPGLRALRRARARLGAAEGMPVDDLLLSQASQADLESFLNTLLRPGKCVLAVEGAFSISQVRTAVYLHFGTWPQGKSPVSSTTLEDPARLTLVPGGPPQAWLGVDVSRTTSVFREFLTLTSPRTSRSGAALEIWPAGFALHATQGNPLSALDAMVADVDDYAEKGISPGSFAEAKRRYAAAEAALVLHPAAMGLRRMAGAPTAAQMEAMDLAAFNAELREAFKAGHRQVVLVGMSAKDSVDPRLKAYGRPEVWIEGTETFARQALPKRP